jgi:mannose-1-phosphate guanylyltransferase/mannose-6-phosphate isomerase
VFEVHDQRQRQHSNSRSDHARTPATDTERWRLLVSQLIGRAASDRDKTSPRTIVILSETSGVPGWEDAYRALAGALELKVPSDQSPADMVRQHLSRKGPLGAESFWRAYSAIVPDEPPPGYRHLANLVAKGHVDLVLTTSWDPLLEISFSKIFSPSQYRVLIRGEFDDAGFVTAMLQRGIPQIVKLNGDLRSELVTRTAPERGSFATTEEIVTGLRELFDEATVIADLSGSRSLDTDVTRLTALAAGASLLYKIGQAGSSQYSNWLSGHARITNNLVTDLDAFMVELDREVELSLRRRAGWDGRALQDEMIRSLELGAASMPSEDVARGVEALAGSLKNAGIEWIAYIDDPVDSSGREMRRLLADTPIGTMPQLRVSMISENGNRFVNRRAVVQADASVPAGSKVAVVDSAAFSGNTMRMAIEALTSQFAQIDVLPAVLVASQSLADKSYTDEGGLGRLVYARVTRRPDITFPWGAASSTDTVIHRFNYGLHHRSIRTFQRPWGWAEAFATSENCSVRVLTIYAGQKISLHRHLCRDELFIALDNGVGVDMSGDEFERGITGEFDSRLKSVTLEAGDSLLIPRGIWHRFHAPRTQIRVLEVAFGVYDEEFDIERLLDLYGRADCLDKHTWPGSDLNANMSPAGTRCRRVPIRVSRLTAPSSGLSG